MEKPIDARESFIIATQAMIETALKFDVLTRQDCLRINLVLRGAVKRHEPPRTTAQVAE